MESPSELTEDNDIVPLEPRRSARTKSTDSQGPKWCPRCSRKMRKSDAGQQVCGRCLDSSSDGFKNQSVRNTRSNLIKPLMSGIPSTRPILPKGRGRRTLLKRPPQRLGNLIRESSTKPFVFVNGQYIQIGDVVSLEDENDDIYFAQITGLMQDHNYEKSATITWLIPTQETGDADFDPTQYTLGIKETVPRKLECMQLVMHLSPEYFKPLNAPYRTPRCPTDTGFIWTRVGGNCDDSTVKS
ncbi:Hypothetical predicted protein [Cloeon dipterum]|uniref:GATA zinc finger domain-containing protein 1 n=1 Tax=Cloeon dipterum TaxID=197152 RepID=A0A8S1C0N3_9INSE|nr:Hypothetical predicted protein [Cloeon dipterum]